MNILSLKKRWNYKLVEYQKRRGASVVFGYPYWLTIDPSSVCNLRCVFCPTGQRRGTRAQAILPFKDFKKIMDRLGPYLLHIDFCNWGEPLLNRELPQMIAYAMRYRVTAKIDTNLNSALTEEYARALIRSGLQQMNVSIDGASQGTYEKYRRDGNYDTIMSNLRLLVRLKKELGSAAPHLHWQFLVFRHNEHEIEQARKAAAEIGVDSIGFTAPFCSPEWVSTKDEYNNYLVKDDTVAFKPKKSACNWLWDGIAINADGSVSPCCSVEDQKDDFGNFFRTPFWLLWNGRNYRVARRCARADGKATGDNVCTRCDHRGASNHVDKRPGTV